MRKNNHQGTKTQGKHGESPLFESLSICGMGAKTFPYLAARQAILPIKMSGQVTRRHPETPPYRCFLSDLTGFGRLRRAGPTRTGEGYPKVGGMSTIAERTMLQERFPLPRCRSGSAGKHPA